MRSYLLYADKAASLGLGRNHARNLRHVYDLTKPKLSRDDQEEVNLALSHFSAYLLGALDLRDEGVLSVFIDPKQGRT